MTEDELELTRRGERKLVAFHPTNVNPRSLTFSPDESKLYFGSFWVNGIFELDVASGDVTRLLNAEPPKENAAWQEVQARRHLAGRAVTEKRGHGSAR